MRTRRVNKRRKNQYKDVLSSRTLLRLVHDPAGKFWEPYTIYDRIILQSRNQRGKGLPPSSHSSVAKSHSKRDLTLLYFWLVMLNAKLWGIK